jgi:hypothetical protein
LQAIHTITFKIQTKNRFWEKFTTNYTINIILGSTLIIEIKYAGLGDHLFHSHLPRIAKESKKYDKVCISDKSKFGHEDYKRLIWLNNPFVDGFINENGIHCDIGKQVAKVSRNSKTNLLDEVMYYYGLDNGKLWNQPELFYKPKYREEFHYTIFDPNYMSWIGNVTNEDAMIFFKKHNVKFDFIMKIRGEKKMFIPTDTTKFIETPTLDDFCDLIFSSKNLHCLTSGTATLASALGRPSIVYYGIEQCDGFKHDKIHNYVYIPRDLKNRIIRKIKSLFQK